MFRWLAQPNLISPAGAALTLKHQIVPMLESYIGSPDEHYAAANELVGGSFLNAPPDRLADVESLLAKTRTDQAELIALAGAIKELNDLLLHEAKGGSINSLYSRVPDALKGLVEISYDPNNFPRFRFIEMLLYEKFFAERGQSFSIAPIHSDARPWSGATPYLKSSDGSDELIARPFADPALDVLFASRHLPAGEDALRELLSERALGRYFVASSERMTRGPYEGDGVRVRYFGHACVLIETRDTSVLVDPLVAYDFAAHTPRFSFGDLPDTIGHVLLTHSHSDHVDFETLLQLRHKTENVVTPRSGSGSVVDPSLKTMLRETGFSRVTSLDELERIELKDGWILGLPFLGEHGDLEISQKLGYAIELRGVRILFLADSNNLAPEMYEQLSRIVGSVEVVFLGMECVGSMLSAGYGPLVLSKPSAQHNQSRRLNGSDAKRGRAIVQQFKAKKAFVYAMGQDPWIAHIIPPLDAGESPSIVESNKFVAECRADGVNAELLVGSREWVFDAQRRVP